ncbi:hypothetical protein CAOG_04881 [Capsaspora owczarzaki ATCC 30864]|uniref:RING-type domain-containing protein n=1 Tax=Capsaspora owczarzaki (strain ATCC 30864) TaxID=595528 RepID=A0A0D2UGJ9_CAPO3|nr:hypothetical protein CAOG_04881 [Capsaspora owczarzaki ATCC 30864]KJE94201.1 hypothetical protein CAOG_004881 [Capsaspora owczarzaki ATCC 30864]|eukprot:XP_004347632.1 hypothetical protein CAOG_04881 [Capsaspora owczarzaki ATCC 30864]
MDHDDDKPEFTEPSHQQYTSASPDVRLVHRASQKRPSTRGSGLQTARRQIETHPHTASSRSSTTSAASADDLDVDVNVDEDEDADLDGDVDGDGCWDADTDAVGVARRDTKRPRLESSSPPLAAAQAESTPDVSSAQDSMLLSSSGRGNDGESREMTGRAAVGANSDSNSDDDDDLIDLTMDLQEASDRAGNVDSSADNRRELIDLTMDVHASRSSSSVSDNSGNRAKPTQSTPRTTSLQDVQAFNGIPNSPAEATDLRTGAGITPDPRAAGIKQHVLTPRRGFIECNAIDIGPIRRSSAAFTIPNSRASTPRNLGLSFHLVAKFGWQLGMPCCGQSTNLGSSAGNSRNAHESDRWLCRRCCIALHAKCCGTRALDVCPICQWHSAPTGALVGHFSHVGCTIASSSFHAMSNYWQTPLAVGARGILMNLKEKGMGPQTRIFRLILTGASVDDAHPAIYCDLDLSPTVLESLARYEVIITFQVSAIHNNEPCASPGTTADGVHVSPLTGFACTRLSLDCRMYMVQSIVPAEQFFELSFSRSLVNTLLEGVRSFYGGRTWQQLLQEWCSMQRHRPATDHLYEALAQAAPAEALYQLLDAHIPEHIRGLAMLEAHLESISTGVKAPQSFTSSRIDALLKLVSSPSQHLPRASQPPEIACSMMPYQLAGLSWMSDAECFGKKRVDSFSRHDDDPVILQKQQLEANLALAPVMPPFTSTDQVPFILRALDAPMTYMLVPPSYLIEGMTTEAGSLDEGDQTTTTRAIYFNIVSGSISLSPPALVRPFGGILADEMGLGKTVEFLSLVAATRPNPDLFETFPFAFVQGRVPLSRLNHPPSLYIKGELQTDAGEPLCRVIRPVRTTLIIAPSPIVGQWQSEIQYHAPSLSVMVYDGHTTFYQHDETPFDVFSRFDIVVTTYDVVRKDRHHAAEPVYKRGANRRNSPLVDVFWFRLCLDEVQMIENPTAAAAVCASIRARYRWGLSGTPISSHGFDDILALSVFLHFHPYSDRLVFNALVAAFEVADAELPRAVRTSSAITSGATAFGDANDCSPIAALIRRRNLESMRSSLLTFLHRLMLRRSKQDLADQVSLPPQHEEYIVLTFSPVEAHFYRELELHCRNLFEMLRSGAGEASASTMSDLRSSMGLLRAACCYIQGGVVLPGKRALSGAPKSMFEATALLLKQTELDLAAAVREQVTAHIDLGAALEFAKLPEGSRCFEQALELIETLAAQHADACAFAKRWILPSDYEEYLSSVADQPAAATAAMAVDADGERAAGSIDPAAEERTAGNQPLDEFASDASSDDESASDVTAEAASTSKMSKKVKRLRRYGDDTMIGNWRAVVRDTMRARENLLLGHRATFRLAMAASPDDSEKLYEDAEQKRKSLTKTVETAVCQARKQLDEFLRRSALTSIQVCLIDSERLSVQKEAALVAFLHGSLLVDDGHLANERNADDPDNEVTPDPDDENYVFVIRGSERIRILNSTTTPYLPFLVDELLTAVTDVERNAIPARPSATAFQRLLEAGPGDQSLSEASSRLMTQLFALMDSLDANMEEIWTARMHVLRVLTTPLHSNYQRDLEAQQFGLHWQKVLETAVAKRRLLLFSAADEWSKKSKTLNLVSLNQRIKSQSEQVAFAEADHLLKVHSLVSILSVRLQSILSMLASERHGISEVWNARIAFYKQLQVLSDAVSRPERPLSCLSFVQECRRRLAGLTTTAAQLTGKVQYVRQLVCSASPFQPGSALESAADVEATKAAQTAQTLSASSTSAPPMADPTEASSISMSVGNSPLTGTGIATVPVGASQSVGAKRAEVCPICIETSTELCMTPCGHVFCAPCIADWMRHHRICPTCRSRIQSDQISHMNMGIDGATALHNSKIHQTGQDFLTNMDMFEKRSVNDGTRTIIRPPAYLHASIPLARNSSTKIDALIRYLIELERQNPGTKSVVFSQWGHVLSRVGEALQLQGIGFTTIQTGKDAASLFHSNPKVTVFLLHSRHKSSGLTLVAATHVFLMDPIINPAVELQAINRVHRIGQTAETHVHRFIVENTIEQQVLRLAVGQDTAPGMPRSTRSDDETMSLQDIGMLLNVQ